MSHFVSLDVDYKVAQESCLVAALEECFGAGNVEVSDKGLALTGYHGDDRSKLSTSNPNYAPLCNIRIKRQHVGSASNDVGFVRTEDGTYKAYISEYDQSGNFNKAKQKIVKQNYTANVSKRELKRKGYTVSMSKQKDGTIKLTASKFSK
jgi:hypothetical protein